MGEQNASDVTELSPDKLLTTFTSKSLVQFMIIAVAIHIVVIGVTSLGTFRSWAMGEEPEAPAEQVQTSPDGQAAAPADDGQTSATAAGDDGAASGASNAGGEQQTAGQAQTQDDGEPADDNPYVESLRETADPDEIPGDPGLDISIEDTSF